MKRSVRLNRECGAKRARVRGALNDALTDCGYDQKTFAEHINISPQAVSKTMSGAGNSKTVLDGLRDVGVPEKLLFDPRRMRAQAESKNEKAA